MAGTQAVYYRESHGSEPVREFTDRLSPKRAAKVDAYIEEYLSGQADGRLQAADEREATEAASSRRTRRSAPTARP